MRIHPMVRFLCAYTTFFLFTIGLLASAATAQGEVLMTLFDAGTAEDSDAARLVNRNKCHEVTLNGVPCLEIEKDRDPYSKTEWLFEISLDPQWNSKQAVLEIQFVDKGAGIITPRFIAQKGHEPLLIPIRQSSYTRLNTMQKRSAFFAFDLASLKGKEAEKGHLAITGLQYLSAMKIHTSFTEAQWQEAKDSVPKHVEPMVKLANPVQLVTTGGSENKGLPDTLSASLEMMHEIIPLAKVLGFTAIETYLRWNWIEPEREGEFDFSGVDALVEKIREYDLKWFPLLVGAAGYALPKWFMESEENVGFVCLEHGMSNAIQSIWSPYHKRHVVRILNAIGNHYEPMNVFEGVRLGPTGNYGESQYPAGGNWAPVGEGPMHIHIGYWAGDEYAQADFREYAKAKYQTLDALNHAWETNYRDFSEVTTILPQILPSPQHRFDMTKWYTDSMTEWCDWWVVEARKALPNTKIYQSSGGWGFRESGTDYTAQTKSMVQVNGGIRLTNETDSFEQNFYATRLAATAARLYGVDLGYEPASSHTARGVVGRIFNTVATNGDHLFTYYPNVMNHPLSIEKWIENLPLLDTRQDPIVDVAIYYPETMNQLDDSTFRHLYAWGFNPRAREIRTHLEVDYLDETLIRDGFLDQYKVLVHVWGDVVEADVLERIDNWVRKGGTLVFPSFPRGGLRTIEGDRSTYSRWVSGDTDKGAFHRFRSDMEPPSLYGDYVEDVLLEMEGLHPWTRQALEASHSDKVFFSIQNDGHLLTINYSDDEGFIQPKGKPRVTLAPYSIERIDLK